MPFKYRTRVIEVEAAQYHADTGETTQMLPVWLIQAMVDNTIYPVALDTYITTPEGPKLVKNGDWIVRNKDGKFSVVADSDFPKIFEPAT